jgi:hypothetical protein
VGAAAAAATAAATAARSRSLNRCMHCFFASCMRPCASLHAAEGQKRGCTAVSSTA